MSGFASSNGPRLPYSRNTPILSSCSRRHPSTPGEGDSIPSRLRQGFTFHRTDSASQFCQNSLCWNPTAVATHGHVISSFTVISAKSQNPEFLHLRSHGRIGALPKNLDVEVAFSVFPYGVVDVELTSEIGILTVEVETAKCRVLGLPDVALTSNSAEKVIDYHSIPTTRVR
jgi:hypothetical protein